MRLNVKRARRLVSWSKPWHCFRAKVPERDEPSLGHLVIELGEQLDAALEALDALGFTGDGAADAIAATRRGQS